MAIRFIAWLGPRCDLQCSRAPVSVLAGIDDPSAVALQSFEICAASGRCIQTVNRGTIADVIYDDFIGAYGFERDLTVIPRLAFKGERGDLVNVGLRKLIGITSHDCKLSTLRGAP